LTNWAIVVGINDYPAANEAKLAGAVADAEDFADWVLTTGGVPATQLYYWTFEIGGGAPAALSGALAAAPPWVPSWPLQPGPDWNRPPSSGEVAETAFTIAAQARKQKLDNPGQRHRCYVFFAGHGIQSASTDTTIELQTCFMLGDFKLQAKTVAGLIPCDDLRRGLLSGGFDEVVMFLDCCRVSDPQRLRPPVGLRAPLNDAPARPVWARGEAAQMGERAYETTSGPSRGAFSKALVQALRTVREPNGSLGLMALAANVQTTITQYTANQNPGFEGRPNNPYLQIIPPQPTPAASAAPGAPAAQPVGAPTAPAAAPQAEIRIDLSSLPTGTSVTLSSSRGEAIQQLQAGVQIQSVIARTGTTYSLDIATPLSSYAFEHPGPEATDVRFP